MDSTYAEVGTEVILLSKSTPFYNGRKAVVTQSPRLGRDGSKSRYCVVDVNSYCFHWRVEDMILASDIPLLTPEQRAELQIREEYG